MGFCLNMFVGHKSMIYAFVESSLFQEQIQMFYSIKVINLFQKASIKINLL